MRDNGASNDAQTMELTFVRLPAEPKGGTHENNHFHIFSDVV
jgi:hypothetical protein